MTQIFAVALLGAVGASTLGAAAHADDFQPKAAGTFLVDLRVTDVSPDASDPITTAAGVATGLHVGVTDSVMPTLGFAYFLTDDVVVEAVLGAAEHDVIAIGAGSSTKAHSTGVLPPVAALQYHFLPKARFSPDLGVGSTAWSTTEVTTPTDSSSSWTTASAPLCRPERTWRFEDPGRSTWT
jgi:outer membrane protein